MTLSPEKLEYQRSWKGRNKDKVRANGRKWYAANKERQAAYRARPEIREITKANNKRYYDDPKPSYRHRKAFNNAKLRARRFGLEFDLLFEDMVWPTHCPVLGIPINYGRPSNGRRSGDSPSLDRLDNNLGYTKDNTVVMSWRANALKKDCTVEEACLLAEYMRKTRSN